MRLVEPSYWHILQGSSLDCIWLRFPCRSADYDSNAAVLFPDHSVLNSEQADAPPAQSEKKISKAAQRKLKQVEEARQRREKLSQVCTCLLVPKFVVPDLLCCVAFWWLKSAYQCGILDLKTMLAQAYAELGKNALSEQQLALFRPISQKGQVISALH